MANEKRLIDANAYESDIRKLFVSYGDGTYPNDREAMIYDEALVEALYALIEAPTVDAVEVVRCKDCKQWIRNIGIADSPNGHCFYNDIETNGHDFCSYGERRTDGS